MRTRRTALALTAAIAVVPHVALPVSVAQEVPVCAGFAATLTGTRRADRIRGTAGRDVIAARGGADVISGLGGDDVVCGDGGDDVLRGGRDADLLDGGPGNDSLLGGDQADIAYYVFSPGPVDVRLRAGRATGYGTDDLGGIERVYGSSHDDFISGRREGVELLLGGNGNDTIEGGAAESIVMGWAGDDELSGGPGDDAVDGGEGSDSMDGGLGDDRLAFSHATGGVTLTLATSSATGAGDDTFAGFETYLGSLHDDTIRGDDGPNDLAGGSGADTIEAGAGDDVVSGGAHRDDLDGGDGFDVVYGGPDDDRCVNGEQVAGCET